MAAPTTERPAGRHPWLDSLLADPASELDNLLSGHARIEPYENADAPDAARLLFGDLAEEDEARVVLDRTLLEWLDSRRVGGVPELDGLLLERWVRKVSEAFEIVGLLKLQQCSLNLRQRFVVWNSWAERLAISAQRDGRYAIFRTLALTQRLAADAEPTANPFALEPLWLRVCEQAGSTFSSHYLALGVLGLRLLPERAGAPSERPWMAGLVRWASGQTPSIAEFSQQWWALKGLYPRMPSYWRTAVGETLRQSSARQMPSELKDWWRQDVKAEDGTTAQQPQVRPNIVPGLPSRNIHELLLKRASKPLHAIRDQIEAHICGYRRFAEATGDSFHIVRSACKIGRAVISGADDPIRRGQLAVDLARQALAWQPANVFAWALWRDALAKQGAFEAAELVGWEAIRRFPENVQWRTQLALLLGDLPGRQTDAELLLRETIDRFPDNVVARNQLAELLIALDRTDEAVGVVDDTFSPHLENETGFDLRARLLCHSGDVEAARDVLRSAVDHFPRNSVLRTHLQMLDDGRTLPLKAAAYRTHAAALETPAATVADIGAAVRQRGRLRWLFSEFRQKQGDSQWRRGALEEVQRILSEDPNLAYAKYLNRELEGADGDGSVAGSFAIAFIDAVKRKDAEIFARLEKGFSSRTQFVDVAKAFLFTDRPAADRALAWLKQKAGIESRTDLALRGFLHQRFDISAIASGDDFVKQIAANDNIQTDLIESALAGDELLLVA